MKIFVLILILNLAINVKFSESGTPTYIPPLEVPPSTEMRGLKVPKPAEENVMSVFEALATENIDKVIDKAEEIMNRIENNDEDKSSLENAVNGIFENTDKSC